jgi:hypothetical protein
MSEFDFGGRRASEFRQRGFWTLFAERHPEERPLMARRGPWFWQRGLPDFALVLSMYVAPAQNHVGVFFGRNEKFGATEAWSRLKPFQPAIEDRLKLRPEQSCEGLGINSLWRVNLFCRGQLAGHGRLAGDGSIALRACRCRGSGQRWRSRSVKSPACRPLKPSSAPACRGRSRRDGVAAPDGRGHPPAD